MNRQQFNLATAECAAHPRADHERRQIRQRFCTASSYCGYHAAVNAAITLEEGQAMLRGAVLGVRKSPTQLKEEAA